MKTEIIKDSIEKYLRQINSTTWINDESYKFEFANYLNCNIDFEKQSNQEIYDQLLKSQLIKYDKSTDVLFIKNSGRESAGKFIDSIDIELFRQIGSSSFENINWSKRTMSYTALSAWIGTLFPTKLKPVPAKGFNETINYLFFTDNYNFPKTGLAYIIACQPYLEQIESELKKYPIEDIHIKVWNIFFRNNPNLNVPPKERFEQSDWNWIIQDFNLFIYRNILKLYKIKPDYPKKDNPISEEIELKAIEGNSKLGLHLRYERDNGFIEKFKQKAIKTNPMLNCEVCGFSFFLRYGEIGLGFIEAHHKTTLAEKNKNKIFNTSESEIALLCSNCHRMVHRMMNGNNPTSIEELKKKMNELNNN